MHVTVEPRMKQRTWRVAPRVLEQHREMIHVHLTSGAMSILSVSNRFAMKSGSRELDN